MKKVMSYDEFKAAKCAGCEGYGSSECGCEFPEDYAAYVNDMQLEDPKNAAFKEFCEQHYLINLPDEVQFECEVNGRPFNRFTYYPEHNLVLYSSDVCTGAVGMTKYGSYVSFDPDAFKSYVCFPPIKKREALFNFADIVRDGNIYSVLRLCPGSRVVQLFEDPDDTSTFAGYYVELPHEAWKYFE